ncbi:MAG: ribbon-helix-helix protein, CopG family [Hyphomonadaceae bacterium]|nr:ribbon-helix-helix protein, CopG family [Hyphomonadaceae bacterium]
MRTRRQVTLHLDPDILAALDAEARRRGLNTSRAANDVLRRVLLDGGDAAIADQVRTRLDRLDKRDAHRARELALVKEALLLFVRLWIEYAGPLEESDDPDAEADVEARYQGFLEMLAGQIGG